MRATQSPGSVRATAYLDYDVDVDGDPCHEQLGKMIEVFGSDDDGALREGLHFFTDNCRFIDDDVRARMIGSQALRLCPTALFVCLKKDCVSREQVALIMRSGIMGHIFAEVGNDGVNVDFVSTALQLIARLAKVDREARDAIVSMHNIAEMLGGMIKHVCEMTVRDPVSASDCAQMFDSIMKTVGVFAAEMCKTNSDVLVQTCKDFPGIIDNLYAAELRAGYVRRILKFADRLFRVSGYDEVLESCQPLVSFVGSYISSEDSFIQLLAVKVMRVVAAQADHFSEGLLRGSFYDKLERLATPKSRLAACRVMRSIAACADIEIVKSLLDDTPAAFLMRTMESDVFEVRQEAAFVFCYLCGLFPDLFDAQCCELCQREDRMRELTEAVFNTTDNNLLKWGLHIVYHIVLYAELRAKDVGGRNRVAFWVRDALTDDLQERVIGSEDPDLSDYANKLTSLIDQAVIYDQ